MPEADLPTVLLSACVGFALCLLLYRKSPGGTPAVLECLRRRRKVGPGSYIDKPVAPAQMQTLLDAAMWAPYHGPRPPWRFVVLGKKAMVEMQQLTLEFYDANWRETGWGGGTKGTEEQYKDWRTMTEEEITGRWGPVSYMVAIVMQRQAGSRRMPEWEEAAATACAVQNMWIQASTMPSLACYWSSWHEAARNSSEMSEFLALGPEDKCFGFFQVAACDPASLKDNRTRSPEKHMALDWRA